MEMTGPREIGILVAVLVVGSRAVDGPPLWTVCALAVAATVAAMLHFLGEWRAWRVASRLALPAAASFAAIGWAHLLSPQLLVVVAPAGAAAVWAIVGVECDRRRTAPVEASIAIGFMAFAAVGGIVPGGLAGDGQSLTAAILVATVVLNVLVGAAVGYRIAKLAELAGPVLLVEAAQYAAIAGCLGALLRLAEAPRLVGPAALAIAMLAWSGFRAWRRAAGADAGSPALSPLPGSGAGPVEPPAEAVPAPDSAGA